MRKYSLIFYFLFLSAVAIAQQNSFQQLKKELRNATSCNEKGDLAAKISTLYYSINSDSTIRYARLTIRYGRQCKERSLEAQGYQRLGVGLQKKAEWRVALESLHKARILRDRLGENAASASTNLTIGNSYLALGDIDYANGRNDDADHYYQTAQRYYLRSLDIFKGLSDSSNTSLAYQNLASSYSRLLKEAKALDLFQKSYDWKPYIDKPEYYGEAKMNMLICQYELGEKDALSKNYTELVNHFRKYDQNLQLANFAINMAGTIWTDDPLRSIALLHTADSISITSGLVDFRITANQYLYELYKELGKADSALYYFELTSNLRHELTDTKTRTKIEELNIRYGTEKKERLLAEKNAAIATAESEKVIFIWSLIGLGIFLIALTAFFIQRQYIQRLRRKREQAAHNEEVSSLLANQELKSIEAMLEGQETERKRIAEDLHDRLGSTLAAAKMYYESTFYDSEIDSKQTKTYELIDKAIKDTREISHNLVSGALSRFGLFVALKDLKETIEGASKVRVNLTIDARDERFHSEVEIQIYRIVQEVFSNALKHSNATELSAQLTQQKHEIHLTVSDNGKGFNPEKVERGMGLNNIRGRVSKLGGTCELKSTKETGTTYSITFNLNHID